MKSNFKKFFNIFSLVMVAISLPLSVYILKNGNLDFTIEAFLNDEPQNVVISDIKASSFKVSWYTDRPVTGLLRLNNSLEPISETQDTKFHEIVVAYLDPSAGYQFQLLSNGTLFDNTYFVTTFSSDRVESAHYVYGQVFSEDGVTAQKGGIVYLTLQSDRDSQELAAIINETGGFLFNLADLKDNNGNAFDHFGDLDVIIRVYTSYDKEIVEKRFTLNLSTQRQIPNIYLADPGLDIIPGIAGE
jgi:hypothetical protein